ncbi:MAG: hypothetical protein P8R43_08160 [Planctomycetota bacterium]|nr:hypothetical protein [Planctomycetota bacterium]
MRLSLSLAVLIGAAIGVLVSDGAVASRSSVRAGTALRMDIEEAFERSDLVLEGRVISSTSRPMGEGIVCTDYELDVTRTFWGDDLPSRTICLPGGVLATGEGMLIPGLPGLLEGEDVVLLLGASASNGLRMPTGLGQGKYRLVREADGDRLAVRTAEDLVLISGGRAREVNGRDVMDYAELVGRIESAAQLRAATAGGGR